ncbi:GNAT family N-acetyltransferase [Kushneria sp. AK178]
MSVVRAYHLEDADALDALYRRSKGDEFRFEADWPDRFSIIPLSCDEARLAMFTASEALVVDSTKDQAAGLSGVIYWQACHIVGLLVAPEARGRGIGRDLMMAALTAMQGSVVTLTVVASNTPAVRLYEALGFQRGEQRTGFYQGVAVTLLTMRRDSNGCARG